MNLNRHRELLLLAVASSTATASVVLLTRWIARTTSGIGLVLASSVLAIGAAGTGLVLVWKFAEFVDFVRHSYRIRDLDAGLFRFPLGVHRCIYEERDVNGDILCLFFDRFVLADGYPAPSKLHLPEETEWDEAVPHWAVGRYREISNRIVEWPGRAKR